MNSRCTVSARRQGKVRKPPATVSPDPLPNARPEFSARQPRASRAPPTARTPHHSPAPAVPATSTFSFTSRAIPHAGGYSHIDSVKIFAVYVSFGHVFHNSGRVRLTRLTILQRNFSPCWILRQQPIVTRVRSRWFRGRREKALSFRRQLLVCHSRAVFVLHRKQHRKQIAGIACFGALLRDDAVNNFFDAANAHRGAQIARSRNPKRIKMDLQNRRPVSAKLPSSRRLLSRRASAPH